MKSCYRVVGALLCAVALAGCSSVYFNTMEKLGVHKRDIMVSRVKAARDSQEGAKQQFTNALEQFRSVVLFKGGDLEVQYNKLRGALDRSESRAREVHDRLAAVEKVSEALFGEWRDELAQYSNTSLRLESQRELDATRQKYDQLITAMKRAEAKLEPVLRPMRDQVLFLKHNLNAKAIGALGDELTSVQMNVDALIRDMQQSIEEADRFIAAMRKQ
jgi:hypothetical protein